MSGRLLGSGPLRGPELPGLGVPLTSIGSRSRSRGLDLSHERSKNQKVLIKLEYLILPGLCRGSLGDSKLKSIEGLSFLALFSS